MTFSGFTLLFDATESQLLETLYACSKPFTRKRQIAIRASKNDSTSDALYLVTVSKTREWIAVTNCLGANPAVQGNIKTLIFSRAHFFDWLTHVTTIELTAGAILRQFFEIDGRTYSFFLTTSADLGLHLVALNAVLNAS